MLPYLVLEPQQWRSYDWPAIGTAHGGVPAAHARVRARAARHCAGHVEPSLAGGARLGLNRAAQHDFSSNSSSCGRAHQAAAHTV